MKRSKLSGRVARNAPLLEALYKTSEVLRTAHAKHLRKDTVNALVEIAQNIVAGNVALTAEQLETLIEMKEHVHKLAHKKMAVAKQRQILQKGGFIGALIGPIIGAVSGLVGALSKRR